MLDLVISHADLTIDRLDKASIILEPDIFLNKIGKHPIPAIVNIVVILVPEFDGCC